MGDYLAAERMDEESNRGGGMTMPDKLYAQMTKNGEAVWYSQTHEAFGQQTEYTRTDISESKLTEALAEIERLREALLFYAEENNRFPHLTGFGIMQSNFDKDQGQRARKALGKE